MNWDAIGAIGQAISALALVVVIVQVRLSTAETLRSVRQTRTDGEHRMLMDTAESQWLNHVIAKAMKAYDVQIPFVAELTESGFTAEEAFSFFTWANSVWLSDQQNITHIDMLSEGERVAFDLRMRVQYQPNSPRRRWFEFSRPTLNQDAVRYLDNLLAQPG